MLDYMNYKSKIPCPTNSPIKPLPPKSQTAENARKWADELEGWEKTNRHYNDLVAVYRKDQARLDELMKEDILKEYRLEGHPKAEKVWRLACEADGGFTDLCYKVEELADLVLS